MEYKTSSTARGTRIIFGDEAVAREKLLQGLKEVAQSYNFKPIELPLIENTELYTDKAGQEILGQMYTFSDKSQRSLCLRPEGTATIQALYDEHFAGQKDVLLYYFTKCYRYERPQKGRYREFYQFGVEWLNPSVDPTEKLIKVAQKMVSIVTDNYTITRGVKRGLSYYTKGGFEISCDELGAQKQVCGGGEYKQGVGFAIGFDRLALLK